MLLQGMCQLFGIFYHHIFETFGQPETSQSGKSIPDFSQSEQLIISFIYPVLSIIQLDDILYVMYLL